MDEHILGVTKDLMAFLCSYCFALNLLLLDSHLLTGLFALGGIVLGRVLDWGWESWKARRQQKEANRLPKL